MIPSPRMRPPQPFRPAPPPQPIQQRRRRVRDDFRWEYLIIPLLLLGVMWILNGVDGAAFSFDNVMDFMKVRNRGQYRQLATIGLVAVAVVWIVRVWKSPRGRD